MRSSTGMVGGGVGDQKPSGCSILADPRRSTLWLFNIAMENGPCINR
jgi:hypothetical protein